MIRRRNVLLATLALASGVSLLAQVTPPWSKGANNPAVNKGYTFQVDDIDNVPDLHGNPADARLVLFIGGNQFFVLPALIAEFESHHPELRGHIFYETLPPGILRKQIANDNTLTLGNLTLQVQPDVYEAGARAVKEMAQQQLVETPVAYATNDLEIMVKAENPKNIRTLNDLGRKNVKLSMPNPAWEGVARQIGDSLRKAGGEQLFHTVYQTKVQSGDTYLTQIHHRQTPMRIMEGKSDAGVTWASEVKFQEKIGNPIRGVVIPATQNTTAIYAAAVLRNAPHVEAARAWIAYLTTPEAQTIYHEYGFQSIPKDEK
ncbi:MAG TPA: substrate-binding domain-containing protein [Acidobacteriaceae bacterium]|jgi:ABC-type molybdate transport system substrate-binding protein|nr:substrate-binding domain-containing protein [Acidobacteriaceae bacterium]